MRIPRTHRLTPLEAKCLNAIQFLLLQALAWKPSRTKRRKLRGPVER
jgi:hypothetical protein